MKNLTILVDMDDTIENLCEAWVAELNKRHGTRVKTTDIREWDMCKAFPTLTTRQIYAPLFDEAFWDTVKPIDGAADALFKLKSEGHRIVIVTASHPDTVSMKMNRVLFKYFPFLTYKDVVIASQKDLISGDVVIDDNPLNLNRENICKTLNILFSAPHNRSFNEEDAGFFRADTWDAALFYIHFYAHIASDL